MASPKPYFIGTDARVILSQWQALAESIAKHTLHTKERLQLDSNELEENKNQFTILSQQEIQDALNGPLQTFFKDKMSAYAKIGRVRLELAIKENDTFKDKRAALEDIKPVPPRVLKNTSLDKLKTMQAELDKLTKEHDQQWQELLMHANEWVLQAFDGMGVSLSILEISEFQSEEPISELMSRITEQRIDLPKYDPDNLTLKDYFTFKSYVIIQSALAREHKPYATADIKREFKALKSTMDEISKKEKELAETQAEATQNIISAIDF